MPLCAIFLLGMGKVPSYLWIDFIYGNLGFALSMDKVLHDKWGLYIF